MSSVFYSLDYTLNPFPLFWQHVDPRSPEDLMTAVIFSGDLKLKLNSNLYKTRKCVLTKTHLYYLSKWNLPKYKVQINWKSLEPFFETVEGVACFGFRLGSEIFQDFYTKSKKEIDLWISHLSPLMILNSFEEDVIVVKRITQGKNSCVMLGQSYETGEEFALKVFKKEEIGEKRFLLEQIVSEILALRTLGDEKIVKLHRVYETDKSIYLLLDYFPKGDLYQKLNKSKRISEEGVVKIIRDILKALKYVNTMGLVHRDIKPENIMVVNDSEIKLIDFGISCELSPGLNQKCGSPGYMAPEILEGKNYSDKVDLFSTGVLMYKMLCGRSLFSGRTTQEIIEKNKKCQISFANSDFKKVSKSTLELLKSLLQVAPVNRCSAAEALTFNCILMSKACVIVNNCIETTPDSYSDVHKQEKFIVYKRIATNCRFII